MRAYWRDIVFGVVFLAPPFLKRVLLRVLLGAKVAPTARIGWFASVRGRTILLGERSVIRACTLIRCDGDVQLGRYTEVSSFVLCYGGASLRVGEHSYVGPQCLVNVDDDVTIGSHSALGPRCMVFTHGSFFPVDRGYPVRLAPVTIGSNTWLAAGVFVHPGVRVGDEVFVNSRAVVSGDIASGTVAEGVPARALFPMERLRRRMSPARVDETMRQVLGRFVDQVLRGELGLAVTVETPDSLRFRRHGRAYRIIYLPATAGAPEPALRDDEDGGRLIVMSGVRGWQPRTTGGVAVLDLPGRTLDPAGDTLAILLADFLRRYYGIRLEYRLADRSTATESRHAVLSHTK